jgi:hypothetical protein
MSAAVPAERGRTELGQRLSSPLSGFGLTRAGIKQSCRQTRCCWRWARRASWMRRWLPRGLSSSALPCTAPRARCTQYQPTPTAPPACLLARRLPPPPPPITDRQWLRRPTIFTPAMSPLPPAPAPIPPCASSHHASVALTRHSMWADMWRVGSGRGQIALAAAEALAEVLVTHAEIVRGGVAPPRQVCTA